MTALLGLCAMMLTVADRPNVVVILADDVGYGDLSCYGATKVQTPNIDRIARDGIRFADAHSPSTVCTPTRYSLMTGEYAFRHAPGAGILNGVAPLSIPADKPTLPKLMKLEGYRTGVVGKWHLGLGKGETDYNGLITPGPEAVGFDESFIMPATGDRVPCVYVENGRVAGYEPQDPIRVSFRAKIGDEPTGRENPELLKIKPVVGHADTIINGVSRIGWMSGGKRARWTDETMADTFAEKAVAFIERNRYKPFFLYLATHDVHAPLLPHERFNGKSQAGLRGDTLAELDWTVGEVQKVLDRHGLTMNTLIVFTSDNGGVESDGYSDPREDLNGHKVNGVLRGFKYSLYEGGHRVPFCAFMARQGGTGHDFCCADLPNGSYAEPGCHLGWTDRSYAGLGRARRLVSAHGQVIPRSEGPRASPWRRRFPSGLSRRTLGAGAQGKRLGTLRPGDRPRPRAKRCFSSSRPGRTDGGPTGPGEDAMNVAALCLALSVAQPPNVLIVLVDDLGWQDTSLAFGLSEKVVGRHFRTPHLEQLAARGVRFDQAYSSCPVCTPTRVALLTGVNPARNHITSWVHSGHDTDPGHPDLKLPDWEKRGLLPGTAKTLAELFRDAGYRTVQVGKAHFGAAGFGGADPTNLGFDRTIGGSAAGHPSSYYGLENFAARKAIPQDPPKHNDVPNLEAYHGKDVFLDDVLATESVKVIEGAAKEGKPLFLWFSPYSVHTPIQANKRFLDRYKGLDPKEGAYATMVETVDDAMGKLLAAFDRAGTLGNTVVVFTSDNGGLSQTARGGYPNLHNLPLRSGKGSAYEGGTRVPLVVAGPGVSAGKTVSKGWAVSTDLYATVAELAGLKGSARDGTSLADWLKSASDGPRPGSNVWHYPHHRGYGGPGLEPFSSIRKGPHKAIFFYASRKWELYDVEKDLGETIDLSLRQPAKLAELARELRDSLHSMGAQFPRDPKTNELIEPEL